MRVIIAFIVLIAFYETRVSMTWKDCGGNDGQMIETGLWCTNGSFNDNFTINECYLKENWTRMDANFISSKFNQIFV